MPGTGDTFTLGPTWNTGGTWPVFSFWSMTIPGQSGNPTFSGHPNGWTVTPTSGTFGDSDLEVDITAPATFPGISYEDDADFSVCVLFQHGTLGGTTYEQHFVFQYDAFNHITAFPIAVARHATGLLASFIKEDDGLTHVYRIGQTIAGKVETGTLDGKVYTAWFDKSSRLWATARTKETPCDAAGYHLMRSANFGATWEEIGTLPFDSTFDSVRCNGGVLPNTILANAKKTATGAIHFSRSLDGGVSWSAVTAPVWSTAIRKVWQREKDFALIALGAVSENMGATWALHGFNPFAIGNPNLMMVPIAERGVAVLGEAQMTSAETDLHFNVSLSNNNAWLGEVIPYSSAAVGHTRYELLYDPDYNRVVITNGRDLLMRSSDLSGTFISF